MEDEAGAPLLGSCSSPLGEEGGFRQPASQVLKAIFGTLQNREEERKNFLPRAGKGRNIVWRSKAWHEILSWNPGCAISLLSDLSKRTYLFCDRVWSPVRWGNSNNMPVLQSFCDN